MNASLPESPEHPISDDEFLKFREFFYRKTGIMFADNKRYFVDKRLGQEITNSGARSFRDYFNRLCFEASGSDLQSLVNSMTVNETYFYRESYQLDCLVRSILPEVRSSSIAAATYVSGPCRRILVATPGTGSRLRPTTLISRRRPGIAAVE